MFRYIGLFHLAALLDMPSCFSGIRLSPRPSCLSGYFSYILTLLLLISCPLVLALTTCWSAVVYFYFIFTLFVHYSTIFVNYRAIFPCIFLFGDIYSTTYVVSVQFTYIFLYASCCVVYIFMYVYMDAFRMLHIYMQHTYTYAAYVYIYIYIYIYIYVRARACMHACC